MTEENALVKQQEFGQAIVDEAKKLYEKQRQELVLKDVQRLMQMRDESIERQKHFGKAAEWYSKKLDALKTGEFTFDMGNATFKFTDPDLDRANF